MYTRGLEGQTFAVLETSPRGLGPKPRVEASLLCQASLLLAAFPDWVARAGSSRKEDGECAGHMNGHTPAHTQ